MSANLVSGFLQRRCNFAFLLSAILSVAIAYGSDSPTNTGKLLLQAAFAAEPIKDCSLLKVGEAQGDLKLNALTNSSAGSSNVLLLTVTKVGERCGVLFGRNFEVLTNQWYDLTFRARTEKRENDRGYGLTVSLESRVGKRVCARTTLPEVGGEWRDYTVALHAQLAHPAAALIITLSEPGAIWFEDIELRQRQTGRQKQTP